MLLSKILLCAATVCLLYLWHRAWQKALRESPERLVGSGWRLVASVLPLLVGGFVLAMVALRGLVRGEIVCVSKGGGCAAPVYLRATEPEGYWVNTIYLAISAAMLLWAAYLLLKRWYTDRD